MLCHNDVCPDNVVFRDGRAAARATETAVIPGVGHAGDADLILHRGAASCSGSSGLRSSSV